MRSHARADPWTGITMTRRRGFELVTRAQGKGNYTLPRRMTKHSPAYDFYSPIEATLRPGEKLTIQTGVKAYFQHGEGLFFITRSGNGPKRRIILANNIALVDPYYYNNTDKEGELFITLVNEGQEDFPIAIGDRFCQAYFQPMLFTDDDNHQDQARAGGLGSTGG